MHANWPALAKVCALRVLFIVKVPTPRHRHFRTAFTLYQYIRKATVTTTLYQCTRKAVVTTTVRLPFHCNSTALRPFDDLLYDRATALRPK